MKYAMLVLLALVTLNAHARPVQGEDSAMIEASMIDGHKAIPAVGKLTGSVVSTYIGSAYGLENYVVTVGNTDAPCEGDDCLASKTFTLSGGYHGAATAVYSRQIDANTYSIAILTTLIKVDGNNPEAQFKKGKILLRVKFNATGVEEIAEAKDVEL